MRSPRRIAITGLGAFTPFGVSWGAVRAALETDRSALAPAGGALPGAEDRTVAVIRDLTPFRERFPEIQPPLPIPITRILLVASQSALEDAGVEGRESRDDFGVMLNRNRGPAVVVAKMMEPVWKDGPRKLSPLLFSQSVANAPLGAVSTQLGLKGPHLLSMGDGAFLVAAESLRWGEASAILCGGFEELEANSLLAGEENGILHARAPPEAYRPHQPDSPGTTLGEGAVCCVLEEMEHAHARGARIYAELLAVAHRFDPGEAGEDPHALHGWGRPCAQAQAETCRAALEEAGVAPEALGLFVGGANGVAAVDAAEREVLWHLGLGHLPPRTLKGHLGETLGMSAAASVACAAEALWRQQVPAATGGEGAGVRPLSTEYALVSQMGYESHYFAAILKRVQP